MNSPSIRGTPSARRLSPAASDRASFVVGADEDHAAGDDRVAVALRAELGHPLHVLLRLDVPLGRQPLHVRDHVAIGRAAPHRPVAGAGIGIIQAAGSGFVCRPNFAASARFAVGQILDLQVSAIPGIGLPGESNCACTVSGCHGSR
jgi:hypothetical protein